jgi:RecJ-like exonuclease
MSLNIQSIEPIRNKITKTIYTRNKCDPCHGRGYITKISQEEDFVGTCLWATMTCGLSLLLSTNVDRVRCRHCDGKGEIVTSKTVEEVYK